MKMHMEWFNKSETLRYYGTADYVNTDVVGLQTLTLNKRLWNF